GRYSVSSGMSAKTGRAPRRTTALTVEENVNAGTITSSPGPRSWRRAAISSACVQDVVSRTRGAPRSSSSTPWARREKGPSPEMCRFATASRMYSGAPAAAWGTLKGTFIPATLAWGTAGAATASAGSPPPGPPAAGQARQLLRQPDQVRHDEPDHDDEIGQERRSPEPIPDRRQQQAEAPDDGGGHDQEVIVQVGVDRDRLGEQDQREAVRRRQEHQALDEPVPGGGGTGQAQRQAEGQRHEGREDEVEHLPAAAAIHRARPREGLEDAREVARVPVEPRPEDERAPVGPISPPGGERARQQEEPQPED